SALRAPAAAPLPAGRSRRAPSYRGSPTRSCLPAGSRPPSRSKSRSAMPGSFKAEAVVLRSIRYGEADRILHLYTAERGRVGAIAKGARRTRSRLGGRLEPMTRVRLVLHQGRGELCTVSQVDTIHAHAALRERRESLERAVQACDAVLRLLDSNEPNRPAYNL